MLHPERPVKRPMKDILPTLNALGYFSAAQTIQCYWENEAIAEKKNGGADWDRTSDPHNAIVVLYQLSYDPTRGTAIVWIRLKPSNAFSKNNKSTFRMTHYELNHVALHVADVDKSCDFYRNVLKTRADGTARVRFSRRLVSAGEFQELHLIGGREDVVNSRPRSNHFALRADNLDEWENYFKENGQEYVPRRTRPDGAFQIYVADPDGYHIELFTGP